MRAALHPFQRVVQRDPGAGDRGRAGAAIGLEHVAIDHDLALADRGQVDHGAKRAPDQALDFLRAARRLAGGDLAAIALMGGARQHRIFGGDPALAGAAQPGRTLFLDGRGAEHRVSPKVTMQEPSA
jgi:hypothetical protein